ncbi:hypothetical protein GLOTRDRAFT_126292 [Gloeophyllum trabeum ATCC 11539]|uniref:Large ribosomal subunit protein mL54 n=1 Tax=Gloeophyllum trabeum (strain ATCC 11539 / FP-39264 / Madison 617) TaxID=670483 RepID=S7QEF6_GLOTA|nr:uncharacterized protein GLOTRDRAFT_126292 [Gloeophyllum trabeum ATCC 11539]EPQ57802.1 hypothetical protein GLOTRDRAFT_126292 [Gloeophyllum trabeum ATCC 11539]
MSLLRAFRPSCLRPLCKTRSYATKAATKPAAAEPEPKSSCPPNTVLVGVNYLKDQPPVLALPDEEYPDWLWKLLEKKELPYDGPGGKAEKVRLRKENRQRIREQNFLKTQ